MWSLVKKLDDVWQRTGDSAAKGKVVDRKHKIFFTINKIFALNIFI